MWSSMVDGSSGRHLIYPFYYHLRWHRIWLYSSHYGALGKRKKKGCDGCRQCHGGFYFGLRSMEMALYMKGELI